MITELTTENWVLYSQSDMTFEEWADWIVSNNTPYIYETRTVSLYPWPYVMEGVTKSFLNAVFSPDEE